MAGLRCVIYVLPVHKTYFVTKILGTSMTEAGIVDGCHVLLEAKDIPESRDIVIACREGIVSN